MSNSYLDHNGLKHYTDKLKQELQSKTGVTSFNGRTGEVSSVSGDYTVSMIPGAVPNTRTINGKSLSSNIVLNASDIGVETPDLSGYVPTTRTVNGKPLSDDITLNAEDIGVTTPDLSGYVPNTRTINGKALSSDILLSTYDIGISDFSSSRVFIASNASATGSSSIAIGYIANASGYGAVAIGAQANATSLRSTSLGILSKAMATDATAIGYDCEAIADGSAAFGSDSHANGPNSIALGMGANIESNGSGAIAIGAASNANGVASIAIGDRSKLNRSYGIAIGYEATVNTNYGIAVGMNAFVNASTGIAIGPHSSSLEDNAISIGHIANAAGSTSVAIGSYANVTADYSSAFGPHAICTTPNTIQLGDASSLSKLSCKVALSVTSDERDKTDITPIGDGAVEFLNRIKAIRYVFNGRELYIPEDENLSDVDRANKSKYGMCSYDKEAHALGTKKGERVRVGVLAQEVQKALQEVYGDKSYANLVDDNFFDLDPSTIPEGVENKLTMTYENFIPFLIKAVQELSADNKLLHEELRKLKEV